MRKAIAAAVAAMILGAAPLAIAAGAPKPLLASGKVKAVDLIAHSVTLDDGATYRIARGVNIRPIKPGQRVTLTFTEVGQTVEASAIAPSLD
jgi:hypothetical protein